ncbi:hypothetical protein M3Y94_00342100 [Aphelenchoides besseyi]|nr:hypothetical protein M3Y94_00342100 [Aphelenchoides besseyi]
MKRFVKREISTRSTRREIDNRSKEFIERLREAVKIPSVSAEEKHRDDVFRMMNWAEKVGERTFGNRSEMPTN